MSTSRYASICPRRAQGARGTNSFSLLRPPPSASERVRVILQDIGANCSGIRNKVFFCLFVFLVVVCFVFFLSLKRFLFCFHTFTLGDYDTGYPDTVTWGVNKLRVLNFFVRFKCHRQQCWWERERFSFLMSSDVCWHIRDKLYQTLKY